MRLVLPVAFLAALAGARAAPDTATHLKLVDPVFRDVRVVALDSCPPAFVLELTTDLPHPGWGLAVDRVGAADEHGRVVIEITAEGKEGLWPQVMTARTARVPLGRLKKGDVLVDVFLRRGRDAAYGRAQAIILRGE